MTNKYDEALKALAPPEEFDPRVFQGDETCSQSLCNFELSLALFFNDFKDIVLGYQLVLRQFPKDTDRASKDLGHADGMSEHLYRLLMGIIHELLELIDDDRRLLDHPYLLRVVKKLHPDAKKAWRTLTSVEVGPKSKDPVARLVHFARNKVAFHYDAKAIANGFRSFVGTSRPPYFSHAPSMAGTRFYFADAAAQQLMRGQADPGIVEDFFSGRLSIFMQVNHAVREVVAGFVRLRIRDLQRKRPTPNSP